MSDMLRWSAEYRGGRYDIRGTSDEGEAACLNVPIHLIDYARAEVRDQLGQAARITTDRRT